MVHTVFEAEVVFSVLSRILQFTPFPRVVPTVPAGDSAAPGAALGPILSGFHDFWKLPVPQLLVQSCYSECRTPC